VPFQLIREKACFMQRRSSVADDADGRRRYASGPLGGGMSRARAELDQTLGVWEGGEGKKNTQSHALTGVRWAGHSSVPGRGSSGS
jgi:hypothetical protein